MVHTSPEYRKAQGGNVGALYYAACLSLALFVPGYTMERYGDMPWLLPYSSGKTISIPNSSAERNVRAATEEGESQGRSISSGKFNRNQ